MSTIIDIYCHIYPDRFFQEMSKVAPNLSNIGQRLRGIKKLFDLDARFKEMDEFGDYRQIISLPNPAIEDIAKPDVGLQLARIANDSMAELCRKYPQRFPSFAAALCLTEVDGSIREAQRAIKDLGARGVLIYTNVAGEPLDQPKFEPLFKLMAELCRKYPDRFPAFAAALCLTDVDGSVAEARAFLEQLPVSVADRERIAHKNAEALFRL